MRPGLTTELATLVGADALADPDDARFHSDATESQGLAARPDAVVLPNGTGQVAAVVAWCYEHDVAIVPRGGGTGFSGGCVAVDGGVVIDLERMTRVRSFDPLLWRMHVEAGLTTADVRRLARENGLLFPPDPGAAEQSQIGGNVATNAGGPHAFKYGVTGRWVTGLEAVVAPGEVVEVGGPLRKDVAGYDLKIAAGRLRGHARHRHRRMAAADPGARGGAAGRRPLPRRRRRLRGDRDRPRQRDRARGDRVPRRRRAECRARCHSVPAGGRCDVHGAGRGRRRRRTTPAVADALREALSDGAVHVLAPQERAEIAALWRWRDGVSLAVRRSTAARSARTSLSRSIDSPT